MNIKPLFDVFLAHNSKDKPQIRSIALELKSRGLNPWLDEEQILPGQLFQDAIQKAIPHIKSAAVFIGSGGIGRWQALELQTLLSQFVEAGIPVIPVLLPGVTKLPNNLLFLKQFSWIVMNDITDKESLDKLERGIRGDRLQRKSLRKSGKSVTVPRDYSKLLNLLEKGCWEQAEKETQKLVLKIAGREQEGSLTHKEIAIFPCRVLCTIDQLWVSCSKGSFGFSVQKQIFLNMGGSLNSFDDIIWEKYVQALGWKSQYTSFTDIPLGYFPRPTKVGFYEYVAGWGLRVLGTGYGIYNRCKDCDL